jgi:hypothetical protein
MTLHEQWADRLFRTLWLAALLAGARQRAQRL